MAIIAPFKGLTYNYSIIKDLSNLVAPPYDVISEDEQEAYYRADPHNVIRLILGKKKTGDSDWDNRYTRAADYLKRWESEGVLIRAKHPCMYVTSMTYETGQRTRWGLITLVRIEDEDSETIRPHESTFSAHKDDRLRLMRACNANFSQIFGLYEDNENTIMNDLKKAIDFPPQISFDLRDGAKHRLWVIHSPPLFKKLALAMNKKPIFIADGHHRYETSRNFRNIMRVRHGQKPSNRAYEFVMMYLSNMNDKGLAILPSHRLIRGVPGFQPEPFLEKAATWFDITKVPFSDTDNCRESTDLKQNLDEAGRYNTVFAFYTYNSTTRPGQYYLFSLKPNAREEMGNDLHPALNKLDVIILSRYILQGCLGFSTKDLDNNEIFDYQHSIQTTISQVQSGNYQMAFLLNPTKIDQVKEIASNSLVMPRKSTFFYPKTITGLVFNKIDPYEIIQTP
jgi:uncharacterized protein (DUF1015 family)